MQECATVCIRAHEEWSESAELDSRLSSISARSGRPAWHGGIAGLEGSVPGVPAAVDLAACLLQHVRRSIRARARAEGSAAANCASVLRRTEQPAARVWPVAGMQAHG